MKFAKPVLASLAATSLVAAPVAAQAAPVRAPSDTAENQELVGGSALLILALLAAAGVLIFVVADSDDLDTDGLPRSP